MLGAGATRTHRRPICVAGSGHILELAPDDWEACAAKTRNLHR